MARKLTAKERTKLIKLMAETAGARSVVGTVVVPTLDDPAVDVGDDMEVDEVTTTPEFGLGPAAASHYILCP